MNADQRRSAAAAVDAAESFDTEQAAIKLSRCVDVRATLPPGALDLYPDSALDREDLEDVHRIARETGCGWDRGARRWAAGVPKMRATVAALKAAGFVVALDLRASLALGED